ncbi:uncharacterized protein [Misgurnus anguillicaudatus]|uniref:uncharacterized protein n=1 Tax=Misgurnus anguillicaudatus TaxID=75329 RepID=UPI003CCF2CE7
MDRQSQDPAVFVNSAKGVVCSDVCLSPAMSEKEFRKRRTKLASLRPRDESVEEFARRFWADSRDLRLNHTEMKVWFNHCLGEPFPMSEIYELDVLDFFAFARHADLRLRGRVSFTPELPEAKSSNSSSMTAEPVSASSSRCSRSRRRGRRSTHEQSVDSVDFDLSLPICSAKTSESLHKRAATTPGPRHKRVASPVLSAGAQTQRLISSLADTPLISVREAVVTFAPRSALSESITPARPGRGSRLAIRRTPFITEPVKSTPIVKMSAVKSSVVPSVMVKSAPVVEMATDILAPTLQRAMLYPAPVFRRALVRSTPVLSMAVAIPAPVFQTAVPFPAPILQRAVARTIPLRRAVVKPPPVLKEATEVCPLNSALSTFAVALGCVWSVFCSSFSCDVSQAPETESLEDTDVLPVTVGGSGPVSSPFSTTRGTEPEPHTQHITESFVTINPPESLKSCESETISMVNVRTEVEFFELSALTKFAEPTVSKCIDFTIKPVTEPPVLPVKDKMVNPVLSASCRPVFMCSPKLHKLSVLAKMAFESHRLFAPIYTVSFDSELFAPLKMTIFELCALSNVLPCALPSELPCALPSELPCALPSELPCALPSELPCALPSELPCALPSELPCALPSELPCALPSELPCALPSELPCALPSELSAQPKMGVTELHELAMFVLKESKLLSVCLPVLCPVSWLCQPLFCLSFCTGPECHGRRPGVLPCLRRPGVLPCLRRPGVLPCRRRPGVLPCLRRPGVLPCLRRPGVLPCLRRPGVLPCLRRPGVLPCLRRPGVLPCLRRPGVLPCLRRPGVLPCLRRPGVLPCLRRPGVLPCLRRPGVLPCLRRPGVLSLPAAPPWTLSLPAAPPWTLSLPAAPPWTLSQPAAPPWTLSLPAAPPWTLSLPAAPPWPPALPAPPWVLFFGLLLALHPSPIPPPLHLPPDLLFVL